MLYILWCVVHMSRRSRFWTCICQVLIAMQSCSAVPIFRSWCCHYGVVLFVCARRHFAGPMANQKVTRKRALLVSDLFVKHCPVYKIFARARSPLAGGRGCDQPWWLLRKSVVKNGRWQMSKSFTAIIAAYHCSKLLVMVTPDHFW